jgi:HEAT repeat protein
MSLESIQSEYDRHGQLPRIAVLELQSLLLSDDPYSAITVAADTACLELSPQIAKCLTSADPIVRWNAAATLFTRFRANQFANQCLDMVESERDEMVRSVALVGLGELLPSMDGHHYRRRAAADLLEVFNDPSEYPEVRCSAYEGILAAMGTSPLERPPAGKLLNLVEDVDRRIVEEFASRYDINHS